MNIVIMGCGRVGAELTVQLAKSGHQVAIVDKRQEAFDRLPPGFEARTVVGVGLMLRYGPAARKHAVPFGPFLAIGGVAGLLAGSQMIDAYLSHFVG